MLFNFQEKYSQRIYLKGSAGLAYKQYVIFNLLTGEYGIDIMSVREITEYELATKIPDSPEFIEGVINVRGEIIPVVNLKEKLNLVETEIKKTDKIIIASFDKNQVGFIVDDASKVLSISEQDINTAPEIIKGSNEKFIVGIAKVEKRMIILLDLLEVFSVEEISTLRKLSSGGN